MMQNYLKPPFGRITAVNHFSMVITKWSSCIHINIMIINYQYKAIAAQQKMQLGIVKRKLVCYNNLNKTEHKIPEE